MCEGPEAEKNMHGLFQERKEVSVVNKGKRGMREVGGYR